MSGKSSHNLPAFMCSGMRSSELRMKWLQWKRGFTHVAISEKINDPKEKKSKLLALGGFDLQDIFYSLPGADIEGDDKSDPFEVAIKKLDEYFMPKQHATFERHIFWTLKPDEGECLSKFSLRAQQQANKCNFGKTEKEIREICVIDKMILLAQPELREKLLKKQMTLDEVNKIVNAHQSIKYQVEAIGDQCMDSNSALSSINNLRNQNMRSDKTFSECTRCGRKGHYATDMRCPAKNLSCQKCNKIGHFAVKCRTLKRNYNTNENMNYNQHQSKKIKINLISSDVPRCANDFTLKMGEPDCMLDCSVGGVKIEMLVDSGSEHNIIDLSTWKFMQQMGVQLVNSRTTTTKSFMAYASNIPLKVMCVIEAIIKIEYTDSNSETVAPFYVIENGDKSLLGKKTAIQLGVLILNLPKDRKSNIFQIQICKKPFPKVKGVVIDLPIDDNIPAVIQSVRRAPIALQQQIEDKLQELLELDIIEKVEGPSKWVSPLVPIIKDNGDLRLCIDMRRANLAIMRENHPLPVMDDFLPRLKNATYFSRLDVKNAFHQLEIRESSRYITTFITHKGMFRYKRLLFGVNCAPEIFQKVMENLLAECENVMNYIDDIIVFGTNIATHDKSLNKVLAVLKNNGVALNSNKCIFKVQSLNFLGHELSSDGIRPAKEKIQSLTEFRSPKSSEELRSFLGLINYVGKFLPDLATKTHSLRQLIRGDTVFVWLPEHEEAFLALKSLLTDVKTLGYFDPALKTRVIADASSVALGAVLIQFQDGIPRIICYASKSLSETERRYCQTEKEALALVWSVERFRIYLLGLEFELETDHKPLEAIFSTSSKPCARIERWVLRLQSFKFKVVYRKGSSNIADPFSRLCNLRNEKSFDDDCEEYILAIQESAAIDVSEIDSQSEKDDEMKAIKECILTGNWTNNKLKAYERFKDEFCVSDNLILRGTKLIIPKSLRYRILQLAHEGHPGESIMKRRLRERVWWSGIDDEAKKFVQQCEGCRLVSLPSRPEEMQRKKLPLGPWIDIAIDFMGPLPSGDYILVIVDYFSRYLEVEILKKITASETIARLNKIFVRLGYPRTITLDNGRQFVSTEFDEFCRIKGIILNNTTPYWPQENGEVERQNRSLLKRLKISYALNRNWKQDLLDFLLMYNSTPHSTTAKTPTELCIGRTIRGKIPSVGDIESTPVDTDFRDRDFVLKEKGKELADQQRYAKPSDIERGDTVLMQNLQPRNKISPTFYPDKFKVINKNGPRVEIQNSASGKIYERNSAHLKKISNEINHEIQQESYDVSVERELDDSDTSSNFENGFLGFAADENENLQDVGGDREDEGNRRTIRKRKAPEKLKDYVYAKSDLKKRKM